ncbi:MBL fold metallo-hydrolase [Argonema antarcticum]|uniref:MBL fold metallo-hydrolase n=1 Tax=Argonema antarcticum TaxID=2942763 RepID=UPI002011EE67|nr:MBL fold metallo-hydrolase [Argonema antarcticum]MCL1469564.1 MBL fold metallo-hydrolase [Argonema antarcticum A004/B2]
MPKQPRAVLDTIIAFPPNRDTLGATAYLIVENETKILVDCPAWDEQNQKFLRDRGGVSWLVVTHRGGIGKVEEIQQAFGCKVLIQEQEAYLLPKLEVNTFRSEFRLTPHSQVIWTPGHSPGSSCLYYSAFGGVLFSGRHLLPNLEGLPVPLQTSKTFHWPRQIRSIELLLARFSPETLKYICPGANTGFLRGKRAIDRAYQHLVSLDLDALLLAKPVL